MSASFIPWSDSRRVLLAWCALAVLMSANGVFREAVLRTRLPLPWPAVVSAALGIVIILAVTRAMFPPLHDASPGQLVLLSAVLVVLTVAFETAVGLMVDRRSWSALFGHYALWRGELWPLVLLVLASTPFLWNR